MSFFKKINWLNLLFIGFLTPVGAALGLIYLIHTGQMHTATWIMALVLLFAAGFGITAGYHRLFSHRTYRTVWPVRLIYAIFGASAFQGSILEWCTDHRNHHLYTDTDKDPYSINKGFWYAHIGWLFVLDGRKRDFSNVAELKKDPIVRAQHRLYPLWAVLAGFGIPTAIAACWGDALGGFIIGGVLRTVVNHHLTFAINSVCHTFGDRVYSNKQSARDNFITAFLTFGEGYHNFHHQFPLDYRNGIRFYQYDPTKWIIKSLALCGMASDLKKVDPQRIMKYRVIKEEAELMTRINRYSAQLMDQVSDYIKPVYNRIILQLEQINEMKKAYQSLKKDKIDEYHSMLKAHKLKLKLARIALKQDLAVWRSLIRADKSALASLAQLSPAA